MINLGDYIGKIISEVAMARVQADIESIKIAELYASNPLLKHMPIPKMKLPNIEVNIPIIISEVDDLENDVERDKLGSVEIGNISSKVVSDTLLTKNIKLTTEESKILKDSLAKSAKQLKSHAVKGFSTSSISKSMKSDALDVIKGLKSVKETINEKELIELGKIIESDVTDNLISKRKAPARIKIMPITSAMQNSQSLDTLTKLKLSLTEECIEWTSIEDDDKSDSILVPE